MIIHVDVLYCYEPNLRNTAVNCFNKDRTCRLINDLLFAIVTVLLPLILIAVFGSLTILRIRSSQSRVTPVTVITKVVRSSQANDHRQRRFKKTDRHLLIMLFIQVVLLAVFTLPSAVQKLYSTFTMNVKKTDLQRTIDSFIYQITVLITYIATGMQFYVNILSGGSVFRKAIVDLQQAIIHKIMCR
jgi:hypothetical protein